MEQNSGTTSNEPDPNDSGVSVFELDQNGVEVIPFDKTFHTGQGEYTGHRAVYIDGESHFVHTLPNFPTAFNRYIDYLEGREPESLIGQVTYDQYTENNIAAALEVFAQRAPNLYQQLLAYREETNYLKGLKARGPQTEEEKAFLYERDKPRTVPLRNMSMEEKRAEVDKNRAEALKRLYYSRSYQLLGAILLEQDPDFDLRVLST